MWLALSFLTQHFTKLRFRANYGISYLQIQAMFLFSFHYFQFEEYTFEIEKNILSNFVKVDRFHLLFF